MNFILIWTHWDPFLAEAVVEAVAVGPWPVSWKMGWGNQLGKSLGQVIPPFGCESDIKKKKITEMTCWHIRVWKPTPGELQLLEVSKSLWVSASRFKATVKGLSFRANWTAGSGKGLAARVSDSGFSPYHWSTERSDEPPAKSNHFFRKHWLTAKLTWSWSWPSNACARVGTPPELPSLVCKSQLWHGKNEGNKNRLRSLQYPLRKKIKGPDNPTCEVLCRSAYHALGKRWVVWDERCELVVWDEGVWDWVVWDEWCEISCVRWVVWDELCEMSGVRWVVWDEGCEMSCVKWVVWDELREMGGVRWVVWDEWCEMSGMRWGVWDDLCELVVWDEWCEMSCVRWVVCEMTCVRWDVRDEFCEMRGCEMSCVRWVVWDELCEMRGVRLVVWDEWCEMSGVGWVVWDELCEISGVRCVVWDEWCEMRGVRYSCGAADLSQRHLLCKRR